MILYESDLFGYFEAVRKNLLANYMSSIFLKKYSRKIENGVKREWNYALKCLSEVLKDSEIPHDTGIRFDYVISKYSSHLEVILAGNDKNNTENIYIIQLLSWQESQITDRDDIIKCCNHKVWKDTVHPSYQSTAYRKFLASPFGAQGITKMTFNSCVYLYDYYKNDSEPLIHPKYANLIADSSLYFSEDSFNLCNEIREHLENGNGKQILNKLHIRDNFCANGLEKYFELMNSNLYTLNIEQKMAAATILDDISSGKRSLNLITGYPGTGKTTIALTILHQAIFDNKKVTYVSPMKAQLIEIKGILSNNKGIQFLSLKEFKEKIDQGEYFDFVICDEAHNIESNSQIKEIIAYSKTVALIYQSSQRIYPQKEIDLIQFLDRLVEETSLPFNKFELNKNIRYAGNASGINWLRHQLHFDNNSNFEDWDVNSFEIEVVDKPSELVDLIMAKKHKQEKVSLLANIQSNQVDNNMFSYKEFAFSHPIQKSFISQSVGAWNTTINEESIHISSVYQVQGMEYDYVGVFIDQDLFYDEEKNAVCIRGNSKMPQEIIKNIYYILLTRGKKGCFIFCRDKALNKHLKDKVSYAKRKQLWIDYFVKVYVEHLNDEIVEEFLNKEEWELKNSQVHEIEKQFLETKKILEKYGINPEMLEKIALLTEKIKADSQSIGEEDEQSLYVQDKVAGELICIFQEYQFTMKVIETENKIEQAIGSKAWSKLNEVSKNFLVSAEIMFETLESYKSYVDFSGVCLQVTKAFEFEMRERFFVKYREYLQAAYKENYFEILPKTFYKHKENRIEEIHPDQYTLGNIMYTIGMYPNGKVIKYFDEDNKLFLEYAENQLISDSGNALNILRKHLVEILNITQNYRNKAAHTGTFDAVAAKECLDYMVNIRRMLGQLLDDYKF